MKKRLLSLVFAVIMIAGFSIPASAAFKADTRESVAVVRIYLEEKTSGDEIPLGWGTGFFVGKEGEDPQYLVTNYHVIDKYVYYDSGELIKYNDKSTGENIWVRSKIRAYYSSDEYEELYPVEYDEIKDIAILKLANPTSKRKPLPLVSPTDDMVGSNVYAVGYPGLSENLFAGATTSFSSSDASVTAGVIGRLFVEEGTGRNRVQIDCEIKHGNSGGPLINENGEVLGVNRQAVVDRATGEEMNYAASIDDVIPLLKRNSVDYVLADPDAESTKGSTEDTSAKTEEKSSGIPIMTFIIIAAVAVVVIAGVVVCIVLLTGKKKKQPVAPVAAPVMQAPVVSRAKTAYVRSLAMQHRGMRVKLNNDSQILLGRSQADCAIVFKEGTPGVSGRHCSVVFESASGDFVITDLRSSYGTFLQNGKKLTPGIPHHLSAGEKFYLGESGNMITLEVE